MVDRFREHVDQVRAARDAGFDLIVMGQHYLSTPFQEMQTLPALARLAAEAGTMRVGATVILLPLLNPVDVAEQVATLDVITEGRFVFGVGLGYRDEENEAFGIAPGERVPRLVEGLDVIKRLWAEDEVTHRGRFFRLTKARMMLKPVQKPHPPIWIGGGSQPFEKVYGQTVTNIDPVLKRIAKYAKTWVPHSSATAEMVTGDWNKIQRFMGDFGRKSGDMTKVYSNFVYVLKKGEKPEVAAPHFKVYSGMDLPYWKEFYLLGEAEELAEKIRAKVAALGGCEQIVLNPLNWGMEQLELLAGEVLPRVAKP
jgi:alkanesulfonate monooxygenase SsuD/methylene tetrahydromethanopterin reductase-like flavin-dependent oxidoreductase (luciferase family)